MGFVVEYKIAIGPAQLKGAPSILSWQGQIPVLVFGVDLNLSHSVHRGGETQVKSVGWSDGWSSEIRDSIAVLLEYFVV